MAPGLRAFAEGNFPLTSASAAHFHRSHLDPPSALCSVSFFIPPAAHMQPNNPPLLFVPDETFIPFDKCTVHRANVLLEAFVVWKVIANQLLMAVSLVSLYFALSIFSVILTSPLDHSIKR